MTIETILSSITRQKNPITGRMEWTANRSIAQQHCATQPLSTMGRHVTQLEAIGELKDKREATIQALRVLCNAKKVDSLEYVWFNKLLEADTSEKLKAIANKVRKDSKNNNQHYRIYSRTGYYGGSAQIIPWNKIAQCANLMIQYDYAKKHNPTVKYLARGWSPNDGHMLRGRTQVLTLLDYGGRAKKTRTARHPLFVIQQYCKLKEFTDGRTANPTILSHWNLRDEDGEAYIPNGSGFGYLRGKFTKKFGDAYTSQVEVTDYTPDWDIEFLDELVRKIRATTAYMTMKDYNEFVSDSKGDLEKVKVSEARKEAAIKKALAALTATENAARKKLEDRQTKASAWKEEWLHYRGDE